jgi:organic hydroperoxide reductase OsmC/OhrA
VDQPGQQQIEQMHHQAHAACFIASSVKTEVRCEPVFSELLGVLNDE